MKQLLKLLVILLIMPVGANVYAQRRVNPVKSASTGIEGKNENKNPADSIDYSKLVRSQDTNGNIILVDTITGREVPDTTGMGNQEGQKIPKMEKPLFYTASVGVDIWDPVMRMFGQSYGLIEFSGELNLHNRYIPVVEIGFGQADYKPDDNNYTYKVPVTPYFRIGANYNFLYNSNPDYMVFAGLRYGWSHFNYEVNDVTLTDSYWQETSTFNLPRQTSNVSYIQVLFGIRVKLFGPISAGWSFRYQSIMHETNATYGKPWYIPGFGSRKASVTGTFSITYTLPLRKKEVKIPEGIDQMPEKSTETEVTVPAPPIETVIAVDGSEGVLETNP